jgi:hypothetical protein
MFPPFSTKFVTLQTHKGQVDVIAFAVELNWMFLHAMNPKEVNTFGYRTICNGLLHTVVC